MGVLSVLSCFIKPSSDSYPTLMSAKPPSSIVNELCHQFSLAEIQSAIARNPNEFSKLGQPRGFKNVFKGYLQNSNIPIAIKRCSIGSFSQQLFSEFKNEIVLLCQLHHPNLMPLTGFCIERNELIIVYEYMSNGSLFDHLHHIYHDPLSWKRRLQICIGVARGLHYLHTGAKHVIIHRHIKTSNILLDDNWEPKVSEEIVDPFLKSKIDSDCWRTFVDITERCLAEDGRERPDMGEVELELEHALQLQEEADAKIIGSENFDRI
ncbi:receptor-like protein kinase FERONIA [Arachis ipaensis]|uniref:receptor-like protein kinase FERONIA n=1 Tax=Arachis ipaensis TaxID=130454 RepID=UPI000A2B6F2E|nr:receptor-like protein kinase FERONIA [Arachis ipaensis]XP_025650061.1 receptor-like protein kinase FERONIA isoform X2 [Arachis hypogaea]